MSTTTKKRSANGEEPGTKRLKSNYFSDNITTILVREEETSFTAHKNTLCKEGVVRLPEAQAETFAVYLHYAYTGHFDWSLIRTHRTGYKDSIPRNFHLWLLANYLQNSEVCNAIVDHILRFSERDSGRDTINNGWTADNLQSAWTLVPEGSNLRRLIIDLVIAHATPISFGKGCNKWPQDLLLAAAKKHFEGKAEKTVKPAGSRRTGRPAGWRHGHDRTSSGAEIPATSKVTDVDPITPTYANRCHHHEHEDGEERCDEVLGDSTSNNDEDGAGCVVIDIYPEED
ncbi:hypothetical protein CLAFUW4_14536 [Fulvia fulva]|uniref:BTB domain-containing protein n=1 Tax=Passalora fulva TaxID=5499 RepID=A0A9Q8UWR4_PASFU|nr:uncharacterized protein CLAFUR5_14367 [Fulvia fulva]KAK4609145.1 hypothetical protein CLAFUR4_14530 [Fulvia fulva]KAK4609691.1 hypothetical protein CLAFUR0_14530 [Fulvia fulva]UJO25283.1 hypothetical protein CLAFUR5_14367 [Fulvia fulva]WPV22779.1 hypothetical protein CLAFUW4_14536 [Fulvia fulva]WPV37556.1 hypothetical protein CLAFUW7_14539 [Fulvia fulva]